MSVTYTFDLRCFMNTGPCPSDCVREKQTLSKIKIVNVVKRIY